MLYIWDAMDVVADGSHNGRSLFNVLKRLPVPQNMCVEYKYPHANGRDCQDILSVKSLLIQHII